MCADIKSAAVNFTSSTEDIRHYLLHHSALIYLLILFLYYFHLIFYTQLLVVSFLRVFVPPQSLLGCVHVNTEWGVCLPFTRREADSPTIQ